MTNPVWQPGPPQVAGRFWIEWVQGGVRLRGFILIQDSDLKSPRKQKAILRHAGPVEIPQPVEPGGGKR